MAIEAVSSLFVYFRDQVGRAVDRRAVVIQPETGEYLANLLVTFAKPETAIRLERSLVLTLDDALSQGPGRQLYELQAVGDCALYLVSFFPDHVAQAELDTALYVSVGSFAYGRAAEIVRASGAQEPEVLDELTTKFASVVDVLGEVAESAALGTVTKNVVKLFDRWKSTGSVHALEAMARAGTFPSKGGGQAC